MNTLIRRTARLRAAGPHGLGRGSRLLRRSSVLAHDSFDRADNATTMGTADSGHAWTNSSQVWGITGNQGYVASGAGSGVATIDVGVTDVLVEIDLLHVADINSAGPIVRYTSNTNFILLDLFNTTTMRIVKFVSGTPTVVDSDTPGVSGGNVYRLGLRVQGTSVTGYLDGEPVLSGTVADAGLQTGTRIGMRSQVSTARRFDNLMVRRG